MKTPLTVSIITPCFNAEKTLRKTVLSVLEQTFEDWELILIDDNSKDSTLTIAQQLADKDRRIKIIHLKTNGGAAKARNEGIRVANGRYIAFIDADDTWKPLKLEKQLLKMNQHQWPFSFTAYTRVNEQGKTINHVGVPEEIIYKDLLKTNYIGCSTAIYDSKSLGKVFMPEIRRRQDYGLWLSILRQTPIGWGINEPLTLYCVADSSLSSHKTKSAQYNWHLYRNIEGLTLVKSIYFFLHYAIRGLFRSKLPRLAIFAGWLHKPKK